MAASTFETTQTAPYATPVQKWNESLFVYPRFKSFIGRHFVGKDMPNDSARGFDMSTDQNSPVVMKRDWKSGKGTRVNFTMIGALSNTARVDGETMAGNEEALVAYEFIMELKEARHAVTSPTKLASKRSVYDFKTQARIALGTWGAKTLDDYAIAALSGIASADGNVVAVAPSRKWVGGQTYAGVMDLNGSQYNFEDDVALLNAATVTDQLFGEQVISTVKRMAQLTEPVMKPVMVDGRPYYVMLISPLQAKALKACTAWINAQEKAGPRNESNPLFSGMLGIWDGVIIHEWEKIEQRYGSGDLVAVGTTTVTMTATTPGTSGTCTAAAGTPFSATILSTDNIDAGVYVIVDAVGAFKVLSRTSDTVCVVEDKTSATAAGGTAFYVSMVDDDGSQFDALDYLAPTVRIDRAIFMGAGALCLGFGSIEFIVDNDAGHDYGAHWGICLEMQVAAGKPRFNSIDRGVIVVDTQVVPD